MNNSETFSTATAVLPRPAFNVNIERYPWDSFLAKSKVPQGQTDELLTWISKVNQKRRIVNKEKEKDLRKVAILESVKRTAVSSLHNLQTERRMRWNQIKNKQLELSPRYVLQEKEKSLCDCDACFLCRRRNGSGMLAECYCINFFSPRPHSTKIDIVKSNLENINISFMEDEHSAEINSFLSSLHFDKSLSCSSTSSSKRKVSESSYNSIRKRCKA